MRFDDNHPGLFTFLMGSVIVVMGGVALSLLADRKSGFPSSVAGLQRELETGATELEQLQAFYQENASRIAVTEPKLRLTAADHQALVRQLRALDQRRTTLEASRLDLQTSIHATEENFLGYRAKHRAQSWVEVVGQPLGDLTVRGGRPIPMPASWRRCAAR